MSLGRTSVVLLFAGFLAMEACAQIVGIEPWAPNDDGGGTGAANAGGASSSSSDATASVGASSSASGGVGGVGTGGTGVSGGASTSASMGSGGGGGQKDTCGDGMHNGMETDIDCGGPMCGNCDPGLKCLDSPDCISNCCKNGRCCFGCVQTCDNYCQDGDETDIDCGGDNCGATCGNGQACVTDNDCMVGFTCQSLVCQQRPAAMGAHQR